MLDRQALYRGKARQTLPPIEEWRRFDAADVQPGLFWCEDLREARRQLMAAGKSPKVASAPGRLVNKIFLKLLKAKRKVPSPAEDPAAQDGKCALCGCRLTPQAGPRGAGEAGLCGQRQTLQGCVDVVAASDADFSQALPTRGA